jgi:hypothetical protein
MFYIPFVRTAENKREATPKLVVPMYSYLTLQTLAKAEEKSPASIIFIFKLLTSILVAPRGTKASVSLSVDFIFKRRSVIAATKHTYLTVSSNF